MMELDLMGLVALQIVFLSLKDLNTLKETEQQDHSAKQNVETAFSSTLSNVTMETDSQETAAALTVLLNLDGNAPNPNPQNVPSNVETGTQ